MLILSINGSDWRVGFRESSRYYSFEGILGSHGSFSSTLPSAPDFGPRQHGSSASETVLMLLYALFDSVVFENISGMDETVVIPSPLVPHNCEFSTCR